MTATRTFERTIGRPASAGARPPRSRGAASMLALQRSAGNTSTMALLRRVHDRTDEAPITLTLPGIVSDAVVSSWSFDHGSRGETTGVEMTRPTDADSPVLARAMIDGPPVDGRVVVRRLTPLGWVHQLTVTMADCLVASFQAGRDHDRLQLTFSRVQVEQ